MMAYMAVGAIVLAFAISALSVPLVRRLAERFGYMDIPQKHKAHAQPTPLLGGVAIFLAILLPSALAVALVRMWAADGLPGFLPPDLAVHIAGAAAKAPQALGILLAALLLHIVGLIDDRRPLGPWSKLSAQVLAATFVVVFCQVRVLTLWPVASIPLSILWIVLITNSFNFLDNMDGLCAGIAAIIAAALLAAAASIGQVFVSAWLCLILGASAGFLVHNFPPARIFMGDAGSLVLGFLLAVVSCLTTYVGPGTLHPYSVLVPVVLMAVPLYDTLSVITLRIREKRNPMIGDRRHFSHRLLKRGMSTRSAVLAIYLCTAGTAISATLLPHVDGLWACLVLLQTLFIVLIIALMEAAGAKP